MREDTVGRKADLSVPMGFCALLVEAIAPVPISVRCCVGYLCMHALL